jgi:hypothetical protein
MFFFPLSFDMWKEEGKWVRFFFNFFFFIIEWLRKGKGLIFFYKFIMGEGGGGVVENNHFQNSRHSWALIL